MSQVVRHAWRRGGKLDRRPERELWIQLSFIYGRPVYELQEQLTSSEFTELAEYIRRNTANPELWWSTAVQTSNIVQALTGEWIPPERFVPGQFDMEAHKRARMEQAERRLDKASE